MISLKWFRENFEELLRRHKGRNVEKEIFQRIKDLDKQIVILKEKIDYWRAERNKLIKNYEYKENKTHDNALLDFKLKITEVEVELAPYQEEFNCLMWKLPAIPDGEVLLRNEIVKTWGELPKKKFYKSYLELSTELKLLDLKLSASIAGAGYSLYVNKGEKLIRALIQFTLDWAEEHGFQRYFLPEVVNKDSLFCTSQLNKFEENLFQLNSLDKFLSPTAEVQLVNIFRDKILSESDLPIKVCANTNCFRNEKIGAGADSKGIMRMFQFNKTEIIMISKPEDSEKAQEFMSSVIENLLQKLNLPYQKVMLSRDEMSFASSKTYDFEVWIPSENKYREISSLSNTRDFQSIRGKIRYKKNKLDSAEKSKYVHILNGSCLAIDRLFVALVENWQTEEGEIQIPECLIKYLGFEKISKEIRN